LSDTPTLPARSGLTHGLPDPDHAYTNAPASPGDSGAAVDTSDGRALGVLVAGAAAFGGIGVKGADAGIVVVTRLAPQLGLARKKTGVSFSLVTALKGGSQPDPVRRGPLPPPARRHN